MLIVFDILKELRARVAASNPPKLSWLGQWKWMRSHEPYWLEFLTAIGLILFFIGTVLPNDPLHVRPVFGSALEVFPDWVWQASGLTLGVAQIGFLGLPYLHGRRIVAFLACWWWTAMLVLGVRSDTYSLLNMMMLQNLIGNGFALLRLRWRGDPA